MLWVEKQIHIEQKQLHCATDNFMSIVLSELKFTYKVEIHIHKYNSRPDKFCQQIPGRRTKKKWRTAVELIHLQSIFVFIWLYVSEDDFWGTLLRLRLDYGRYLWKNFQVETRMKLKVIYNTKMMNYSRRCEASRFPGPCWLLLFCFFFFSSIQTAHRNKNKLRTIWDWSWQKSKNNEPRQIYWFVKKCVLYYSIRTIKYCSTALLRIDVTVHVEWKLQSVWSLCTKRHRIYLQAS